ncbi:MAG: hypothetical protein AAF617_03315 [Bacteroidota bacterium]
MWNFLKQHTYIITLIWVGMVLAISFMEAPLKFQSELVDTRVGVSIGRIVFTALNRIELFFVILLIILTVASGNFTKNYLLHALTVIIVVQTFILLPFLDERAVKIIQMKPVEDSIAHLVYIVLEIIKVIALLWISIYQIKKLANYS